MSLFEENVKGASYDERNGYAIGHTWSGTITEVGAEKQATEYIEGGGSGAPLFFPSGDPIMEQPITFQTDQVQPQGLDEDGRRVIYFGGEKIKALKAAMRAAGIRVRMPRAGDWFALTWSGHGGKTGRRKTYTAQFRPGPEQATGTVWNEQAPPAQSAPVAPPQAPAMAGAPANNGTPPKPF